MNFHSLRSFLLLLLALGSAALVSSCGGGGANSTGNAPIGGLVRIEPDQATLYAGIPFTFALTGGRPPYTLTSSEPSLIALPQRTSAHSVTVIPNNPGVVDADLQEGELPVKTVRLFIRDATGDARFSEVQVAQNFLTGYGISLTPTTCPGASAGEFDPPGQACAGGETAVTLQATFQGNLHGNEAFRLEVLRGNFSLRNPATGQVSQSITTNSDHSGTVTGIITVPPGVNTQLAVIRVIHVPTGVYADHVFVITRGSATASQIVAIPDEFIFTGPLENVCGTGVADFFVFDGVPPYTAVSSSPAIQVTPSSGSQPGRFTITANRPDTCVEATIVVTDSLGGRDTVSVTTEEGEDTLPEPPDPEPLDVGPTTVTLGCAQAGSVSVAGGLGNYRVNSSHPTVSATVSGNTVTISRAGPAGPGSGSQTTAVSITDGAEVVVVDVTSPATCP